MLKQQYYGMVVILRDCQTARSRANSIIRRDVPLMKRQAQAFNVCACLMNLHGGQHEF